MQECAILRWHLLQDATLCLRLDGFVLVGTRNTAVFYSHDTGVIPHTVYTRQRPAQPGDFHAKQ